MFKTCYANRRLSIFPSPLPFFLRVLQTELTEPIPIGIGFFFFKYPSFFVFSIPSFCCPVRTCTHRTLLLQDIHKRQPLLKLDLYPKFSLTCVCRLQTSESFHSLNFLHILLFNGLPILRVISLLPI